MSALFTQICYGETMKKLVSYIFLSLMWFNVGLANDIREIDIGGISIGDSLLDHLSKEEIMTEIEENKPTYNYLNNDFGEVYLFKKIKNFELLSFFVRPDDKYYTIYSISGMISFDEKFEACLVKQKEFEKKFSKKFKDTKKQKLTNNFEWDPTGESFSQNVILNFNSGDNIQINCTKYKKSLKIENGWNDGFVIAFNKKEVTDWFDSPIN